MWLLSNRTCKQLWSHVDGGPNNATRHHGLWFTEAQVGDLCTVLLVQLEKKNWSGQIEKEKATYCVVWFLLEML